MTNLDRTRIESTAMNAARPALRPAVTLVVASAEVAP